MRLKICQITSNLNLGGQERVLVDLARYFKDNGHDPLVWTTVANGELVEELLKHDIPYQGLHLKGKLLHCALKTMHSRMKKVSPDVVITHGNYRILARIAAITSRVPVRVHVEHNVSTYKKIHYIIVNRMLARFTDRIVCISDTARNSLLEIEKINPEKAIVIPNGVNTERFKSTDREEGIGARRRVGIIARFYEQKGHIFFVKAIEKVVREVRDVEFWFVGDGPLRAKIEAQVAAQGLQDYCLFFGFRADVASILKDLDLFVLSSLWEGMPISLLEAQYHGIPSVVTNVGGNPEVITDGFNGLLVPPKDPDALARSILKLLRDKEMSQELGRRAREVFFGKYTIEKMGTAYLDLIEAIYATKGARMTGKVAVGGMPAATSCDRPREKERAQDVADGGKKRIAVVGGYPPPYGGISVHIQRLKREYSDCFMIHVIDVYNGRDENPILEEVYRCGGTIPFNLWRSVKRLREVDAHLVHFHVSAMAKFAVAGFLFVMTLKKGTKKIITIHSGSFIQQYRNSGRLRRLMVMRLLRVFDRIISVNAENKKLLKELGIPEERISLIPAFLPPIVERSREIDEELNNLRDDTRKIVLVSGCARKYYGFHLVLDALDDLGMGRKNIAVVFVFHHSFHHSYDNEYVSTLERSLERGVPYRIFKDLNPGEFSFLLSKIDIYVRATDRDGDAVTLREAIYFGKQTIASDCVKRPRGVVLFETGRVDSLRKAIEKTMHGSPLLMSQRIGTNFFPYIERCSEREKIDDVGQGSRGMHTRLLNPSNAIQ
jgi:glycogen(starch) synthase